MSWIQKYRWTFVVALFGTAGGYLYWYFWGCTEGCTIRSVWWRMSLWGLVMGALVGNMIDDRMSKNTTEEEANHV